MAYIQQGLDACGVLGRLHAIVSISIWFSLEKEGYIPSCYPIPMKTQRDRCGGEILCRQTED